jgi:hypothetical protein
METLFVLLWWPVAALLMRVVVVRLRRLGLQWGWLLFAIAPVILGFASLCFELIVAHYHLHGAMLHWVGHGEGGGEDRWWYPTLMYGCFCAIVISPLIEKKQNEPVPPSYE